MKRIDFPVDDYIRNTCLAALRLRTLKIVLIRVIVITIVPSRSIDVYRAIVPGLRCGNVVATGFVSEANLGVHIACLRKALRENSPDSTYIETVTRYGYRFVGEVSVINESAADTTVRDLERDQGRPILFPETTEATFLFGDGLRLET